jgi:aminoglycoside phosphotransferase (APT) family kinase protein
MALGEDAARAVRAGEELDTAALEGALAAKIPGLTGPLAVEQFPSGHSNLTYLLRMGGRELVLRRPPFGARAVSGHDMGREMRVLSALHPVYPRAPRPLAFWGEDSPLGVPFYVMERVRGVILRGSRGDGRLSPEVMRGLSEGFVDALGELHAVDAAAAGLGDLGRGEGYAARQVSGWTQRYEKARTDEVPEIEAAARWLASNVPADSGACLIHNDFKYDNLVLDPAELTRIVAVLDWEMATVGDPLMDLGSSLGYWLDPDDEDELRVLPLGPTALRGNLGRRELVERYAERTGREVQGPVFYYVYGLFKLAGIAQQIYYRYVKGFTKDERFAAMIHGVQVLGRQAARAIEKGRIDRLGD